MNTTADKVNRAATVTRQLSHRGMFSRSEDRGSFFRPAKPFIQPKLEVSKPDDLHEREAEQTADHVMRMPEPAPVAPPRVASAEPEKLQRLDEHEEEEVQTRREPGAPVVQCSAGPEEHPLATPAAAALPAPERRDEAKTLSGSAVARMIQRRSGSLFHSDVVQRAGRGPPAAASTFESQLQQSRGSGQELPANTRSFMENRFQSDFGGVRVHTGATAQTLSKSIHAQAFTHGGDIYFNSGKYDPDSGAGRTLIAHELTHTIQQGASPSRSADASISSSANSTPSASSQVHRVSRQIIQREVAPQLTAAVAKAKGEEGKVNANKPGPDGNRTGWDRLLEYFKTSMGPDKIVPGAGGGSVPGTVSEQVIKTKSQTMGQVANQPPDVQAMRDAMPSWCGIFAFWALNQGGVPMPKWVLGGPAIKPEAAYPPDHTPTPGDIAYRNDHSHYAIVEKTSGAGNDADITTVNGNTTGEDNLGGQVQTRTHKRAGWTGFFNPLVLMQGSLRDVENPQAKPKTLEELRRELFHVDQKPEGEETVEASSESAVVHTKSETATVGASEKKQLDRSGEREHDEHEYDEREIEEPDWTPAHRMIQRHALVASQAVGPVGKSSNNVAGSFAAVAPIGSAASAEFAERASTSESARGPPISQHRTGEIVQRNWLGDAWDAVGDLASDAIDWAEDQIDKAKTWLLEKVRNFVRDIPGYKMLTFILGKDPITGEHVERNGRNLLYAGLQLLPFGVGTAFQTVIERIGAVDDIAGYLDRRIEDLKRLGSGIADRFSQFWDSISLSDVRHPGEVLDRVADLFKYTITSIVNFVENAASDFLDIIKRIMLRLIVEFVRSKIPRWYPLLCVALGHDPVTNEEVERNGTNILNAVLEVSEEGREQRRQMQETGTFKKIAGFIDRGIHVFTTAYHQLRAAFSSLWDAVTDINTLVDPSGTFDRIWHQFTEPVLLVTNYVVEVALEILRVIKEVLMRRLAAYARTVRGYPLITVIIGRDPFTGEHVERNVENVIHGFMSLMEGGEEQFQQMKQSGAIDQTAARIHAAVERLNMTPASIIQLFIDLWHSFSLRDLIHPIAAFERIIAAFGRPILRLIAFVIEIIKIVIEVVLRIMHFPVDLILNILNKAAQAYELIKADPIGFLKNLLRSIKQGFTQFFDNIITHLLHGVTGWLMSELQDAGVPTLSDFSLQGVISWVLEVLGISMEKIWEKLAAHPRIGPARVAQIRSMINRLEGIWTFIKDVQERGMAAIWDKIQEQLTNLWDTVLDAVKNWIMDRIINAIVQKLLSMLDPTGIMAVINSALAIYRAVQSFIKYLTQMLQVVNSFVEGVLEIAQGNITIAANALENAMDRAMPIVIGFLANQVGLGGIGHSIGEMIERVREMVDKALTWLVNKAVDTGFAMFDRAVALGKSAVATVRGWVGRLLGIEKPFQDENGGNHRLFFTAHGNDATLMLNPLPATAFEDWVNSIQPDISTDAGKKRAQKKTEAIAKAQEIDAEKAQPAATGPGAEAAEEDKAKRIRQKVDELSALTGPLFTGERPPCSTEANGGLVLGGLQAGKYGSTMAATTLTTIKMPAGSVPSVSLHQSFNIINQRRNQGGSYYILGHLLNHNLGGTGQDWRNLTPLTRDANSAHERIAEARVKNAVDAGNIVRYSVRAEYGRSVPTSPDPTIREIMQNEADVPTRLVCEAEMITPTDLLAKGGTARSPLVPAGTVIDNRIGQTPADYDLVGVKHATVYLDSGDVSAIGGIPGVNSQLAQKIVDACNDKESVDQTRFVSFNALADYVLSDGRRFTDNQKATIGSLPALGYVNLFRA